VNRTCFANFPYPARVTTKVLRAASTCRTLPVIPAPIRRTICVHVARFPGRTFLRAGFRSTAVDIGFIAVLHAVTACCFLANPSRAHLARAIGTCDAIQAIGARRCSSASAIDIGFVAVLHAIGACWILAYAVRANAAFALVACRARGVARWVIGIIARGADLPTVEIGRARVVFEGRAIAARGTSTQQY